MTSRMNSRAAVSTASSRNARRTLAAGGNLSPEREAPGAEAVLPEAGSAAAKRANRLR
jgi:hypothetical protein